MRPGRRAARRSTRCSRSSGRSCSRSSIIFLVTNPRDVATGTSEVRMQRASPGWAITVVSMCVVAAAATAQPPPSRGHDARVVLLGDGSAATLRTTWGTSLSHFSTTLLVFGHDPIPLARERAVAGTLVSGHDLLLVATMGNDAHAPFEVRVGRGVGRAFVLGDVVPVQHPASAPGAPLGVAAAMTPTGFALFFQETELADPSAAHTYLVRLRADGTLDGAATEVPIPWSAGDALWNGHGFHLALFYPGNADGMRLSMVSVTEAGR